MVWKRCNFTTFPACHLVLNDPSLHTVVAWDSFMVMSLLFTLSITFTLWAVWLRLQTVLKNKWVPKLYTYNIFKKIVTFMSVFLFVLSYTKIYAHSHFFDIQWYSIKWTTDRTPCIFIFCYFASTPDATKNIKYKYSISCVFVSLLAAYLYTSKGLYTFAVQCSLCRF